MRNDAGARLNWLLAANEAERKHQSLFRSGTEEEQMLLMNRPLSAEKAYALFGALLGTLPPAAIFTKLLGYGLDDALQRSFGPYLFLFILCSLMNIVCGLGGYWMGTALAQRSFKLERRSWTRMLLMMPLIGLAWGASVGATGGLLFFGIGAFFGAAAAIPIGIIGFVMFALLHRMLERGGMIETRHFLPLACGISLTIAAFILGL
jgi:hypothetical protein